MEQFKISYYVYPLLSKRVLRRLREKRENNSVNNNSIIIRDIIYQYYGVKHTDRLANSRKEEYAMCRHLCIYFQKKYTLNSFSKIGFNNGNRSHATAINSIKVINNLLFSNKSFEVIFSEIERIIIRKIKK